MAYSLMFSLKKQNPEVWVITGVPGNYEVLLKIPLSELDETWETFNLKTPFLSGPTQVALLSSDKKSMQFFDIIPEK